MHVLVSQSRQINTDRPKGRDSNDKVGARPKGLLLPEHFDRPFESNGQATNMYKHLPLSMCKGPYIRKGM